MIRTARAFALTALVLLGTLPILYVGAEGVFYLATGTLHFPPNSGYRTLYYPLDALGDRWPAIYDARESLANVWLRLSNDPLHKAVIHPDWHLSPYGGSADYVRYFPPDPEFNLSREAAALQQSQAGLEAATGPPPLRANGAPLTDD
ncbi:MAG TPA: hypothetical protein VGN57_20785 [Pirellulaceae bacterium]|jgi:hypothetical protein|nr:hypothetical protein [Pirellulaceae bacterium]